MNIFKKKKIVKREVQRCSKASHCQCNGMEEEQNNCPEWKIVSKLMLLRIV